MAACFLLAFVSHSQAQVINEVAASNNSSVENGGKFPDWIELFNPTAVTVNLASMSLYITNWGDPGSSANFTFPAANILLNPQSFLVVWCDTDTNAPGYHTGYKIPGSGGATIMLRDSLGGAVDQIGFGLQLTDLTIGRVPDGSGGFQLTFPTPALANIAQPIGTQLTLKFNEWMATNSAGVNKDWLELFNPDPLPVPLGNLVIVGSTNSLASKPAIPPLSFIAGSGFFRFWCDGNAKNGADHLDFKLSSTSGESNIWIYLPDRVSRFEHVEFPANQVRDQSEGRLPDGGTNIVRFPVGRDTPGDSNFLPLTNIVINEFLTHTDPPLEDAIELYNPTGGPVDISYWWLSNNRNNPFKFRIPAGTTIAAGGYKVFYEQIGSTGGFNTSGTGNDPDFTLNAAHGGELYLFTSDVTGKLTGFRRGVTFDASAHGVSFERYVNSVGDVDITAAGSLTFGHDNPINTNDFRLGTGLPNSYPMVGPIVINEIMYHPPNINVTNDNSIDEYIELHNIASTNVPFFWVDRTNKGGTTIVFANGWKLDDAVTYQFPAGITIPPSGFVLAVNFDPQTNLTQLAAFRSAYGIPGSFTSIYGPYAGKLKNSSASVKLYRPDPVQEPPHPDAGFVPFVLMDKVSYSDSAPWPATADGLGSSLQRRRRAEYGNDPINWGAMSPTPGRSNVFTGTITVNGITRAGARVDIAFSGQQGQAYTVEYTNSLPQVGSTVPWPPLTNITATGNGLIHVGDLLFSPTGARFYRVSTPTTP